MANITDTSDYATELEEAFRLSAEKAARTADPAPHDFDGETCYDCGVDMIKERLAHGFWTCVPCKTVREKKQAGYRR